jgi:hypothetical protein
MESTREKDAKLDSIKGILSEGLMFDHHRIATTGHYIRHYWLIGKCSLLQGLREVSRLKNGKMAKNTSKSGLMPTPSYASPECSDIPR